MNEQEPVDVFALAAKPIGNRGIQQLGTGHELCGSPEAIEAAKRASKRWLPAGRRTARDTDQKEAEAAFYERQTDIEDAVVAAGGEKGRTAA